MQQPHTKNEMKNKEVEFAGIYTLQLVKQGLNSRNGNGPRGNENVAHVEFSHVGKFETRAQTSAISTCPILCENVNGAARELFLLILVIW